MDSKLAQSFSFYELFARADAMSEVNSAAQATRVMVVVGRKLELWESGC